MSQRVTLDDTALRARLRSYQPVSRSSYYIARSSAGLAAPKQQLVSDFQAPIKPKPQPAPQVPPKPKPPVQPIVQNLPEPPTIVHAKRQQASQVLVRQFNPDSAIDPNQAPAKVRKILGIKCNRTSLLTGMAVVLFVTGITVSLMGFHTNRIAQAQETHINKQIDKSTASPDADPQAPSTTQPSARSVTNYTVAADLARYIIIPKVGVNARVLQVGTKSDGSLNVPSNVYDAAWYNKSAKPGEPGATLIDGHVSSWTTNGVFYGIKKLVTGDAIKIQKGDGTILTYSVVKTVSYDVDKVDMQSLVLPVITGKSGLNLITCGGKYDSKSGEFTQRIAVYASLNS